MLSSLRLILKIANVLNKLRFFQHLNSLNMKQNTPSLYDVVRGVTLFDI